MNVYALDGEPEYAARAHCDAHAGPQLREALALLYFASPEVMRGFKPQALPAAHPEVDQRLYDWARESRANFEWLLTFAHALAEERRVRFQVGLLPSWAELLMRAGGMLDRVPDTIRTDFVQVLPEAYRLRPEEAVKAYRHYYKFVKARMAHWECGTPAPSWWAAQLRRQA